MALIRAAKSKNLHEIDSELARKDEARRIKTRQLEKIGE